MPLADLPGENEWLALKFNEKRPEEAGRYFSALKALFDRHAITMNKDCKLGSLKYLTIFTERLWKATKAFANQTKTYDEYKAEVLKLYP